MGDVSFISWIPRWVNDKDLVEFGITTPASRVVAGEPASLRCLRPCVESWPAIGEGLRDAANRLRGLPISRIVAAIDRTAQKWCDRNWLTRLTTRDRIASLTGMSHEIVDHSFDLELRNYRRGFLERTLQRELGNPEVLDGFQADPWLAGQSRALGPRITLEVFTGNVPGLPALEIVRALLVKSAVVAKVASGEPIFASQFVRSLCEVEPCLANALLVTYWDRNDSEILGSVIREVDAIVAYGSLDACAAIRSAVLPGQIFVEHGHKVSYGLVSKAYLVALGLADVGRRIAADVSAFNQHACIAPQAYFVEGAANVDAVGREVAQAMDAFQQDYPLGRLSDEDAAMLQLRRAAQQWQSVAQGLPVWQSEGTLDWTVAVDAALASDFGSGHRFVRLVPVTSLQEALKALRPVTGYLQNVALGVNQDELPSLCEALAQLGPSRICGPGRMAEPSMMWRHDGRPCVADLVRWCDLEMYDGVI